MKRLGLACVLTLLMAGPAEAGSIFLTDIRVTAIDPPATTFTGFDVKYNTSDISGLTLKSSSEAPTTFLTNGTTDVSSTFAATGFVEFKWLFDTSASSISDLNVDILGLSNQLKGVNIDVTISAVPAPETWILLSLGMAGLAAFKRRFTPRAAAA